MFPDASANEVAVAGLAGAGAEDEATLAASAPEGAFEVVVVNAFASSRATFNVEDLLNALEEVGCDEGFVAPGVFHAVISDGAEVVAVAQYVADGVDGDRARTVSAVALGVQSGVGEGVA